MSHVDEGLLHAYLDDAIGDLAERRAVEDHLEACATCRKSLAAARQVRDRAAEILRGAAAPSEVPPYEHILARRARGSGSRLGRLRVIGLAATLALAIGVIWYARELMTDAGAGEETAAQVARTAERQSSGPTETGPAGAAQAPGGAGVASEAGRAATPVGGGVDARRQEADRVALDEAPSDVAAARNRETEERAAEPARPAAAAALEQIGAAEAPVAKAANADRPRDSVGPSPPDPQPAAAESGVVDGLRVVAAATGWIPVSADTAAAYLGRRPAVVPDLVVAAYGIRQEDSARRVRVVQTLNDGTVIELIERRLGEEAAQRAMGRAQLDDERLSSFRSDSAATVRIEWNGYEIIGRAALPAESLRVLMQRIR